MTINYHEYYIKDIKFVYIIYMILLFRSDLGFECDKFIHLSIIIYGNNTVTRLRTLLTVIS